MPRHTSIAASTFTLLVISLASVGCAENEATPTGEQGVAITDPAQRPCRVVEDDYVIELTYDDAGRVISQDELNLFGEYLGGTRYEYADDRVVAWHGVDRDGMPTRTTELVYEGDVLRRVVSTYPDEPTTTTEIEGEATSLRFDGVTHVVDGNIVRSTAEHRVYETEFAVAPTLSVLLSTHRVATAVAWGIERHTITSEAAGSVVEDAYVYEDGRIVRRVSTDTRDGATTTRTYEWIYDCP